MAECTAQSAAEALMPVDDDSEIITPSAALERFHQHLLQQHEAQSSMQTEHTENEASTPPASTATYNNQQSFALLDNLVYEAIEQVRRWKERPNQTRIVGYLRKRHKVDQATTERLLDDMVKRKRICRVWYMDDVTYRSLEQHRRCPRGSPLSSSGAAAANTNDTDEDNDEVDEDETERMGDNAKEVASNSSTMPAAPIKKLQTYKSNEGGKRRTQVSRRASDSVLDNTSIGQRVRQEAARHNSIAAAKQNMTTKSKSLEQAATPSSAVASDAYPVLTAGFEPVQTRPQMRDQGVQSCEFDGEFLIEKDAQQILRSPNETDAIIVSDISTRVSSARISSLPVINKPVVKSRVSAKPKLSSGKKRAIRVTKLVAGKNTCLPWSKQQQIIKTLPSPQRGGKKSRIQNGQQQSTSGLAELPPQDPQLIKREYRARSGKFVHSQQQNQRHEATTSTPTKRDLTSSSSVQSATLDSPKRKYMRRQGDAAIASPKIPVKLYTESSTAPSLTKRAYNRQLSRNNSATSVLMNNKPSFSAAMKPVTVPRPPPLNRQEPGTCDVLNKLRKLYMPGHVAAKQFSPYERRVSKFLQSRKCEALARSWQMVFRLTTANQTTSSNASPIRTTLGHRQSCSLDRSLQMSKTEGSDAAASSFDTNMKKALEK